MAKNILDSSLPDTELLVEKKPEDSMQSDENPSAHIQNIGNQPYPICLSPILSTAKDEKAQFGLSFPPVLLASGLVLDNRYKIMKKIGSGGTASVYLAEHIAIGNVWAVKVLAQSDRTVAEHLKEADILKQLNHPMLPRIADIFNHETSLCIVMDYIRGKTLVERLEKDGHISEVEVCRWMIQLCEVLNYLHEQKPEPIIYRDLKPANLISDELGHIKLIDFGTARAYRNGGEGDTTYIGTQGYAAPEQYGLNQSDSRTDIYNLGMTAFHLLTGSHPISIPHGELTQKLNDCGISTSMSEIICKCIQLSPQNRYQNAMLCRQALVLHEVSKSASVGSHVGAKAAISDSSSHEGSNFYEYKKLDSNSHKKILHKIDSTAKLSEILIPTKTKLAFMSVCQGAGSTFSVISIASFLANRRIKTAVLEMNASGDLLRLRRRLINEDLGLERVSAIDSPESFRFQGVDYIPSCKSMAEVRKTCYDVILIDVGSSRSAQAVEEYQRADYRFAYCPSADWKIDSISDFIESMDPDGTEGQLLYLVPQAGKKELSSMKPLFGQRKTYNFPYISNPFKLSSQENKSLEELFRKARQN